MRHRSGWFCARPDWSLPSRSLQSRPTRMRGRRLLRPATTWSSRLQCPSPSAGQSNYSSLSTTSRRSSSNGSAIRPTRRHWRGGRPWRSETRMTSEDEGFLARWSRRKREAETTTPASPSSAEPATRDFIGLAENQWDFNAPDGVPGFGSLLDPDQVRRLLAKVVGGEEKQ